MVGAVLIPYSDLVLFRSWLEGGDPDVVSRQLYASNWILYFGGQIFSSMTATFHQTAGAGGRILAATLTWLIPHLDLLDLTEKAIHAEAWRPLTLGELSQLAGYGLLYTAAYFAVAAWVFHRRPL